MTHQMTAWTEFFAPDASTDRGWLKAITGPWTLEDRYSYTSENSPVWDEDINAWREQSTLGNYLDYRPCRPWASADDPQVHAICYTTKESRYCMTVAEAKAWIEERAKSRRPELVFQQSLTLAA